MSGQRVSVCRATAEGKKTFLAKRTLPYGFCRCW